MKIDVLGNTAEVLVNRSDYGANGEYGVSLNNPDTTVDEIAVKCTDGLLHCRVPLEQRFGVGRWLE